MTLDRRLSIPLLAWLIAATAAQPCTTFILQDQGQLLFGRNLDWDWEDGMILVNPRGLRKTAMVEPHETPATWVAKFGSVTFNQFGRDQPFGGMNEAGLVVEQMMLMGSRYPEPDRRPAVDMLQWIQYQLDTASTVAQVLESDTSVRIAQPIAPPRIHFLVCDASGDAAVIEFLDGRMVVHRGESLPYRALTNSTYARSQAFAASHPGASRPVDPPESLPRFACVAARATEFTAVSPDKDVAYAFESLDFVRAGRFTVWQLVYDIPARRIHLRTASNPATRKIDLASLAFSPAAGPSFAELDAGGSGEPVRFAPFTEARHRAYLESFLGRKDVRGAMGDLRPHIEPMLATLRSYTSDPRE